AHQVRLRQGLLGLGVASAVTEGVGGDVEDAPDAGHSSPPGRMTGDPESGPPAPEALDAAERGSEWGVGIEEPISAISSARAAGSVKAPRAAKVRVDAIGWRPPRIVTQPCSASSTTSTPRVSRFS